MQSNRYDRKKQRTRALIVDAATRLFHLKGYGATSLEDISEAADIATRTIYLHFDSKAAIALSFFDEWLVTFEKLMTERPAEETPDVMLLAVFDGLHQLGWGETDGRVLAESPVAHPYPDLIFDGPADIAGHVFQAWTKTQQRLAELFTGRLGLDVETSRAVAAGLFAAWLAALHGVRAEANIRLATPRTAEEIGLETFRQFTRGLERKWGG